MAAGAERERSSRRADRTRWAAILATVGVVSATLFLVARALDGYLFPVAVDTKIIRIEPVGDSYSRIWGSTRKVRDCSFRRVRWFLGTPGKSAEVQVVFEEQSKLRDPEGFNFGPWLVQLTPEQLQGPNFAIVEHECPWTPWITRTPFYP